MIVAILGTLYVLLSSFVVALSGAVVPGPLFTVTLARTAEHGEWEGLRLIVGHMLLEMILLTLILLGFAHFLNNRIVIGVASVAGSAFLIYFGIHLATEAKNMKLPERDLMATPKEAIAKSSIVVGMLATVGNPYWLIWWVTVGMAYLGLALRFGPAGVVAFFIGHIFGDFVWYGFVSFVIARGVKLITVNAYHKAILVIAGLVAFFGVIFGIAGVAKLINTIAP